MPIVLTDGVVVLYALWTVVCNVTVILGGTPTTLARMAGLVGAGILALTVVGVRRGWAGRYFQDAGDEAPPALSSAGARGRWLLVALGTLAAVLWFGARAGMPVWALLAAATVVACILAVRPALPVAPTEPIAAPMARREARALHAFALFACAITLLAFRPREDDSFYLHLAVSLLDYPDLPLLSVNTIHGLSSTTLGPQPMFPPYRVHSFELLGGLLSQLSGLSPAVVVHLGIAGVAGWLSPFAIARLLRILAPRGWLLALAVVFAFYLLEASAARGYSNQAFVRLFHGKSILLTLGVPLLLAYGLRFGQRPTAVRFALLACAQIAAVGLSSTAIWLAPTLALIAVVAGTRTLRQLPRHLGASALSSSYVLLAGVWVMAQLGGPAAQSQALTVVGDVASAASALPLQRLGEGIPIVLGGDLSAAVQLGAVLLLCALATSAVSLRLFAASSFIVALGFANPWLAEVVARGITGQVAYERIFWLLPIPIAVALCVVEGTARLERRVRQPLARLIVGATLVATFLVGSERIAIGDANASRLVFPPTVKLWPEARALSLAICRGVGRQDVVLGPAGALLQLPTLSGCGAPLMTDPRWMASSIEDETKRARMVRYVSERGAPPIEQARWFVEQLHAYDVSLVALSEDAARSPRVKSLLRKAGFEKIDTAEWNLIYAPETPLETRAFQGVAKRVCAVVSGGGVLTPFGVSRQLEAQACGAQTVTPTDWEGLDPADDERRMALERLVFLSSGMTRQEAQWLVDYLRTADVRAVVIGPNALGNRSLKTLLPKLGFRFDSAPYKHQIYVRPT